METLIPKLHINSATADALAEAFQSLAEGANYARRIFLRLQQPAIAYALAGRPYGRNRRGKKRWTLERKRARAKALPGFLTDHGGGEAFRRIGRVKIRHDN